MIFKGLLIFCMPTVVMAALTQNSSTTDVVEALRSPRLVAAQKLKGKAAAISELERIAFSEEWPMSNRWKAFMVYSKIKKDQAVPIIKTALIHKTWFMRSAGLTALLEIDPKGAKKWAFKIFSSDKALLVRMKALEILKDSDDAKVKALLWAKLFSEDNRNNGKSLWIRGDIARVLLSRASKNQLSSWVTLLHDADQELQEIASQALKKVHGENDFEANQVSFWKDRFPKKSL